MIVKGSLRVLKMKKLEIGPLDQTCWAILTKRQIKMIPNGNLYLIKKQKNKKMKFRKLKKLLMELCKCKKMQVKKKYLLVKEENLKLIMKERNNKLWKPSRRDRIGKTSKKRKLKLPKSQKSYRLDKEETEIMKMLVAT